MITEEKQNFKNWTCISSSVRIRLAFESAMHPTRDTLAPLSHPTGYYIEKSAWGLGRKFRATKAIDRPLECYQCGFAFVPKIFPTNYRRQNCIVAARTAQCI